MIEYTWKIAQLDAYPEKDGRENVVFTVHWRLGATQDAFTSLVYGSVGVELDAEAPFTPFDALTEEMVVSWVESALGEEQVEKYKDTIAADLAQQRQPSVVNPALPWAAE